MSMGSAKAGPRAAPDWRRRPRAPYIRRPPRKSGFRPDSWVILRAADSGPQQPGDVEDLAQMGGGEGVGTLGAAAEDLVDIGGVRQQAAHLAADLAQDGDREVRERLLEARERRALLSAPATTGKFADATTYFKGDQMAG